MTSLCALIVLASGLGSGLGQRKPDNNAQAALALVPWPQSIKLGKGTLRLEAPTIFVGTPSLKPVALILADDIYKKTGVTAKIVARAGKSSISLKLGHGAPEGYRLEVSHGVSITAPNVRGISWGATTCLQAVSRRGNGLELPKVTISDGPALPYRGLMVDVARKFHSIDTLKQCVELCRLYKLNYLQLHLTDDQAFTFPSLAYPLVNSANQHGGPSYTHKELKDLVHFADERGVTLIPEMDVPGHSATLNRTMPGLFKIKGTKPYEHHATINFANDDVLEAVETLVGEMCDVFASSPYFHMGGDEADFSLADQHPDFQAAFRRHGLPDKSQQELYRRFLTQVNAIVRKRGKQLIVWEGFGRDPNSTFPIPKDILVMEFENAYFLPTDLLADGYSLVNASWTPLYVVNRHVWPARRVYEWDVRRFGRFSNLYQTTEWFQATDASRIVGAQVCSWESPEEIEIENLRRVVPAMAERVWNPSAKHAYEQFLRRLAGIEPLLDKLVHPVLIQSTPLDATDPNGFDVPCFTRPISVSLSSAGGGTIHYTIDGSPPSGTSATYEGPLRVSQTATVRAALFDAAGKRMGYGASKKFYYVPPRTPNLATGKPVTVSGGTQGSQAPELAVDDNLDLHSSWWAAPAPQWLRVDLGRPYKVDRIDVFPFWDGRRYYQYTIEVSVDGATWSIVADQASNTKPASDQGDEARFAARDVRYVRVNMLRGSANEAVHLVELRVWEAK